MRVCGGQIVTNCPRVRRRGAENAAFWQEIRGKRRNYHVICAVTRRMRKKVGIDGGVFAPEKLWIFCELWENRYVSENLILF